MNYINLTIKKDYNFESHISQIDRVLPDLCTSKDVAKVLNLTRTALCKMRQTGNGPPFIQITPGKILYLKTDIIDWLKGLRFQIKSIQPSEKAKFKNSLRKKTDPNQLNLL